MNHFIKNVRIIETIKAIKADPKIAYFVVSKSEKIFSDPLRLIIFSISVTFSMNYSMYSGLG